MSDISLLSKRDLAITNAIDVLYLETVQRMWRQHSQPSDDVIRIEFFFFWFREKNVTLAV